MTLFRKGTGLIDAVFEEPEVAAYLRVSSRSQNAKSQQSAISLAAKARGARVTRWYHETMTGKTRQRPELERLLEDARRGEFNVLWVFRLDRLTRSGIRDTLNLLEELKTCGCQVVSVADGFALDGPWSDVILSVIAWAAQMERAAIGDRVSAARVRLASQGRSWGRPNRLSLEETDNIRALSLEGQSIRTIAQTVRVPKSTVQRALASQKTEQIQADEQSLK